MFVRQLVLLSFILIWRSVAAQTTAVADLPDSTQSVTNEDVRKIAGQLIAPCCWTMTADAHSSPIAYEVRAQIREALAHGESEEEILQAYVAQYGERILARPTKQGFNLLAWILPFAVLFIGGWILWRFLHRHAEPAKAPMTMAVDANDPYTRRVEKELKRFDR